MRTIEVTLDSADAEYLSAYGHLVEAERMMGASRPDAPRTAVFDFLPPEVEERIMERVVQGVLCLEES